MKKLQHFQIKIVATYANCKSFILKLTFYVNHIIILCNSILVWITIPFKIFSQSKGDTCHVKQFRRKISQFSCSSGLR